MANEITKSLIANSDSMGENTKAALSYYDKTSQIIKRTHAAMGRSVKVQTTTLASTINEHVITTNCASTH